MTKLPISLPLTRTPVTAIQLLTYIAGALLLQLTMGIGLAIRQRKGGPETGIAPVDRGTGSANAAWQGWRDFRVVSRVFEDAGRTQCSFYIEPIDGLPLPSFNPGQYLTFSLQVSEEGAADAGRTITRCYSLSDSPNPARYRVTIKKVLPPAGRSDIPAGLSSTHFHDRVREGDILKVKAPSGRFFLDPDPAVPAVFLAGGIGITPMMSMLKWCLAEQPLRAVHLYYGVRHSGEHAFKEALETLATTHPMFHLNVVYSRASQDDVQGRDYQHAGHVGLELLRRTLPHGRHQFYVCGPPPMMASMVPALHEWGVLPQDVHHEAFGPASAPGSSTPSGGAGFVAGPIALDT